MGYLGEIQKTDIVSKSKSVPPVSMFCDTYSLLFTHLWNIIMYMYTRFDFVVNAITISMSYFVLLPINAAYTIYEWRLLKHCIAGPVGE